MHHSSLYGFGKVGTNSTPSVKEDDSVIKIKYCERCSTVYFHTRYVCCNQLTIQLEDKHVISRETLKEVCNMKSNYCEICNTVSNRWFCCNKRTNVLHEREPLTENIQLYKTIVKLRNKIATLSEQNDILTTQLKDYADHILG